MLKQFEWQRPMDQDPTLTFKWANWYTFGDEELMHDEDNQRHIGMDPPESL